MGLGGFKSYLGIWFFNGVFMKDEAKVLVNAQEGVTKALRQWRFTSAKEIKPALIKKYVQEAIKNAKAGKEIKPEKKAAIPIPVELQNAFKKNKSMKPTFTALTPFKQREYLEYITEAKTEPTRIKRVEKITPMILAGKGLNDKYR